jgi:AcrR family transcriptional regulator
VHTERVPTRAQGRKRAHKRPAGTQLGELAARGMILQGAMRVFADMGFRAASVEDVLVAAGVSRRTFYRLYKSKDEVAAALYQVGTGALVEACKAAVRQESDPTRQLERCIDAHLENARQFGRLVFVLGGEAQSHDSPLYARRMEVHDTLVAALVSGAAKKGIDPLVFHALIIALEGVTRIMLQEGDEGRRVTDAAIERVRRVMRRVGAGALLAHGDGVPPLPNAPG